MPPNSSAANQKLYGSPLWEEVEEYFENLNAPGFEKVTHASDLVASPDSKYLAFTGSILKKVEFNPDTRVCLINLTTKQLEIITEGPNHDQIPAFSPDGKILLFLSDIIKPGVFQPCIQPFMNGALGAVKSRPPVPDIIEYQYWSPDTRPLFYRLREKRIIVCRPAKACSIIGRCYKRE